MSARPLAQPLLRPWEEGVYRLAQDYEYVWREDLHRCRLWIPSCYDHDGASVPRLVWTLTGLIPTGLISAAALVHDWLYLHEGRPPFYYQADPISDAWKPVQRVFARSEADSLFHRIMREAGVSAIRSRIAYLGVRAGGWVAWLPWRSSPSRSPGDPNLLGGGRGEMLQNRQPGQQPLTHKRRRVPH